MTNQVTFTRGDRRFDLDISRSYTVEQLGRMFSLEPSSVWLKRNFDQRAFFPTTDGRFDFPSFRLSEFDILNVEGEPANSTTPTVTPSSSSTLSATTSSGSASGRSGSVGRSYPGFTSVVRRASSATFNLKIVRARISHFSGGRPSFEKQGQMFLELSEATANQAFVLDAVQREWGEDFVVVTADGLEISNSPGTQGL